MRVLFEHKSPQFWLVHMPIIYLTVTSAVVLASVLSLVVGRSEINKTTKISLDKMLNIKKNVHSGHIVNNEFYEPLNQPRNQKSYD